MNDKDRAEQKVSAAAKTCEKVQASWHQAYRAINTSATTNGCGIYHDQFAIRNSLLDARAHIDTALAQLDTIDWPTDADYSHCD